jgi:hypothetical protein
MDPEAPMSQQQQPPPSTSEIFLENLAFLVERGRHLARRIGAYLTEIGEPIAKPLFAINRTSALIRNSIFVAGFLLWTGFAYITNEPDFTNIAPTVTPPADADATTALIYGMLAQLQLLYFFVLTLIKPYFAANVLRHVLPIALAFWVAFRWASIYLDDIFELEDVSVAGRFIRQAAFGSQYNRIVISEGDIAPEYKDSPIYRIGGPGLVRIQLENAALFEKIDGTPHIIGPSRRFVQLEGFERLRRVFDLRDQFDEDIEVTSRSKDGIVVTAKDLNLIFSVHRNQQLGGLSIPGSELSFTEEALKNLVYHRTKLPWQQNAVKDVQEELKKYISGHTINEFLENVSEQERNVLIGQASDPT